MHKHQFVHSVFIALQLPITGCGVNPARSFAPAVITNTWNKHWVRLSEAIKARRIGVNLIVPSVAHAKV